MSTEAPRSQVRPRTVWTVGLNLLGLVLLVQLVRELQRVVGWVLIALLLSLALQPIVKQLHRWGLPRVPAVALVFLCLMGLMALMTVAFIPLVSGQIAQLIESAPHVLARLREVPFFESLDERFNLFERLQQRFNRMPIAAGAAPAIAVAQRLLLSALGVITILVLTLFMLLFGKDVLDTTLLWLEPRKRTKWKALLARMNRKVGGYVLGTLLVAAVGGIVVTIGMFYLGVPWFLALGLLYAVLGLIPWVGSAIVAVVIVTTTFATTGQSQAVIALVAYLVYQQVENQLLHPLVQRRTIKMNPLIIALVLLFGTAQAGILGALLALPIAGAVQVILRDSLARRRADWAAPRVSEPENRQLSLTALWRQEREPPVVH